MNGSPLFFYLMLAALFYGLGLYGALTKRNTIVVLFSIELMINAANLNLIAFSKYGIVPSLSGQLFTIFSITIAAAEIAVGLAILISLYRNRVTVNVDEIDTMKH